MTGERTERALARISAALARIETAGAQAARARAQQDRRYDALRQAVTETLRDLDLLIAGTPEHPGSEQSAPADPASAGPALADQEADPS